MTQNYFIRNKTTKAILNTISWDGATLINVPDGYEAVPCSEVTGPIVREVSSAEINLTRNADTARAADDKVAGIFGTIEQQMGTTAEVLRLTIEAFLSTNPTQTAAVQTLAGTFAVVKAKHDAVLAIIAERDAAIASNREPNWP